MSRVMCIWFPNWPIQRWQLARRRNLAPATAASAVALFETDPRRGGLITACSPAAAQQGVRIGLPVAEAQALLKTYRGPTPEVSAARPSGQPHSESPPPPPATPGANETERGAWLEPHDRQADRQALRELAWKCQQYSPLVGLEESETPDCLLLEITGCAHLFGDENGLAGQVVLDLYQQGLFARIAIAETVGSAWAVAHYHTRQKPSHQKLTTAQQRKRSPTRPDRSTESRRRIHRASDRASLFNQPQPLTVAAIVEPGQQRKALEPLPVAALRLPNSLQEKLLELGIERVAQLQKLPRSRIPARFGKQLTRRLDQALGTLTESITAEHPELVLESAWELEVPTDHAESLRAILERLVHQVTTAAEKARHGILQINVQLRLENADPLEFPVGLSRPTWDARHLNELLEIPWQRLRIPGRVQRLQVRVTRHARIEHRQRQLFAQELEHTVREQHLAGLLDRLSQRLGPQAVTRPELQNTQHPQHLVRLRPVVGEPAEETVRSTSDDRTLHHPSRPLLLAETPVRLQVRVDPPVPPRLQQIHWQNGWLRVIRQWGPERIESEWWTSEPLRRDYYRVQTHTGQEFWIFQQLDTRDWFWHGAFD